jgi:hypothetical protein
MILVPFNILKSLFLILNPLERVASNKDFELFFDSKYIFLTGNLLTG